MKTVKLILFAVCEFIALLSFALCVSIVDSENVLVVAAMLGVFVVSTIFAYIFEDTARIHRWVTPAMFCIYAAAHRLCNTYKTRKCYKYKEMCGSYIECFSRVQYAFDEMSKNEEDIDA